VDDNYFISGSLDAKVRIWSIPDHQVVDWNDLHEMVTAACYTPDGQGALVGSYKGTCCLYNTHDNKLQQRREINLKNRKKKTHHKKITGFQVKLKQLTPFCSHLFIYTTILFWMLYWFI
jgi:WD40 repeat protein